MNKVLLSFDESNFSIQKEGIENCLPEIQKAVNEFNAFGYEPLTNDELQRLFTETNDLFFDKITKGQPLSIGGLDIDKTKALEIIKKPTGFESLIKSIADATKALQDAATDYKLQGLKIFSIRTIQSFVELNAENIVVVKSGVLDELKKLNELYAQTPVAIKLHELAVLVAEKCKDAEIANVLKSNPDGISKVIKSLFKQHSFGSADVIIDVDAIAKYNKPGYKY